MIKYKNKDKAYIKTQASYNAQYNDSIINSNKFWEQQAESIDWIKRAQVNFDRPQP